MTALEVFVQQNGEVTKTYYAELCRSGPIGLVAMNLFRAQKRSEAAKRYRGGGYRAQAYDVKNWSIEQLSGILKTHAEKLGIRWGWGDDEKAFYHAKVIYVDLPQGQVSFHSATRPADCPDYPGEWDGQHMSRERILAFCDLVLTAAVVAGGIH